MESVFQLGRPDLLLLLWTVPVLVVFQLWVFRRKTQTLQRFAQPEMIARITAGVSRARQVFKVGVVLLGATAAILALTEPRYGFTWEEVQREGIDLVVALDVSDSMLVEDAESGGELTRLDRAKREITDLLRLMEGDRVALVAFAGTAFVECPLTLDYGAASLFLDAMDPDLIPVKGTAIGRAIRTSVKALESSARDARAVLLITDGEDHSGQALTAAEEAREAGVRVFAIGIGRDEGSPIPAPDGGLRRDRAGELVLSKLDEPTLQKIALTTGGSYVRSVTGDVDLEKVYFEGVKATLEDQELSSQRRQRWTDRFQWLVALAILALAIEPFIPERVRRSAG